MAKLEQTIHGHLSDINGLHFSEDKLASCSSDRTVRLWALPDFSELPCSPLLVHTYPVHNCVFSPDGATLVSCSTDGKCVFWDANSGEQLSHISHPSGSSIRTCAFSPSGQRLATGCDDNKVGIWDVPTKKLLKMLIGQESTAVAIAFTPDNAFLVTGSIDGHLFFWDAAFGHGKSIKWENDAHDLGVTYCVFSPTYGTAANGQTFEGQSDFLLATCGFDNMIKLWNFSCIVGSTHVSVALRCTLEGHGEPVLCCNFSPSGETLVSGSNDHTIRLWDVYKGVEITRVEAHTRYVTSACFSRNGALIASASNDKSIKIWRIRDIPAEEKDLIDFGNPVPVQPKAPPSEPRRPEKWNVNDVCAFLAQLGLSQYTENFRGNAIDGVELLTLTHNTLQNALRIEALGHRNKILRAIEQIQQHPVKQPYSRSTSKEEGVEDELLCPITMELMRDPVIASDGYTYERAAIAEWISSGKTRSPMTNAILPNTTLTPNRSLKLLINKHLQQHS